MSSPRYQRAVLKISGEMLAGERSLGIDPVRMEQYCAEIAQAASLGVELLIVVGGGNIFRGIAGAARGMDRTRADQMGMLATAMNAIALQEALVSGGCPAVVLSAIAIERIIPAFTREQAVRSLRAGKVVVCAGGTGHPYFSTDTAAALRAAEVHADVLLKATKVDGVYDRDPAKHPNAVRFQRLTHADALARRLQVMDATAFGLCLDNDIPLIVFDLDRPGNIHRALSGESVGTLVVGDPRS